MRPRLSRSKMLVEIEAFLDDTSLKYKIGPSAEWLQYIHKSKFNLAPRGFGRTSYRLAEIVQIGRIPVYMYDDFPWLPYAGTEIDLSNFGFSGQMGSLRKVVTEMNTISPEKFQKMIQSLAVVRKHYTYSGVINQIEMFIRDPLGLDGGHLRCCRVPDKEH